MPDTNEVEDSTPAPACTPSWNTRDPHQQEVSRILKTFQYDIMGITSLGIDGIMRSLTADRKVLSAEAFTPALVKAMLDRLPADYRATSNQHLEDADGLKTPKEKWFSPDDGVLPPPLSKEKLDEVRNSSKEKKDVLRKMVREREDYVDTSGVLNECDEEHEG